MRQLHARRIDLGLCAAALRLQRLDVGCQRIQRAGGDVAGTDQLAAAGKRALRVLQLRLDLGGLRAGAFQLRLQLGIVQGEQQLPGAHVVAFAEMDRAQARADLRAHVDLLQRYQVPLAVDTHRQVERLRPGDADQRRRLGLGRAFAAVLVVEADGHDRGQHHEPGGQCFSIDCHARVPCAWWRRKAAPAVFRS